MTRGLNVFLGLDTVSLHHLFLKGLRTGCRNIFR